MPNINVEIPTEIHEKLKERASFKRRSIKKEIVAILEQFLSDTREVELSTAELEALREMRMSSFDDDSKDQAT